MDGEDREGLLYPAEVFRIQGALFEVYRTMGAGYLEAVYQECLGMEFAARSIPFRAQPSLALEYKGVRLKQTYVADFVCFDSILIELKASSGLVGEHRAQTLHYLRATGLRLGLLVNFGAEPRVKVERFAL
jgi:GxxExxY protein